MKWKFWSWIRKLRLATNFFDLIRDSAGCFSRQFWKMKTWSKTCKQVCLQVKIRERKQNFAICMTEKFQSKSWPQTNNLQTKLIQKFLHKKRSLPFWMRTLMILLRVDESCFIEALSTTPLFLKSLAWLMLSFFGKQHQRLFCGTSYFKSYMTLCSFYDKHMSS